MKKGCRPAWHSDDGSPAVAAGLPPIRAGAARDFRVEGLGGDDIANGDGIVLAGAEGAEQIYGVAGVNRAVGRGDREHPVMPSIP